MKKLLIVLASFASLSAFAGNITVRVGDQAYLPECGGRIYPHLSHSGKHVMVDLFNVENCSNFDIVKTNGDYADHPNVKLDGYTRDRSLMNYEIDSRYYEFGFNTITLRVNSNSHKHSDTIKIKFFNLSL